MFYITFGAKSDVANKNEVMQHPTKGPTTKSAGFV